MTFPTPEEAAAEIERLYRDRDEAFDGSKRRPRRALKPLERDILCRVITDILGAYRRDGLDGMNAVPLRLDDLRDLQVLHDVRNAIDPRDQ